MQSEKENAPEMSTSADENKITTEVTSKLLKQLLSSASKLGKSLAELFTLLTKVNFLINKGK